MAVAGAAHGHVTKATVPVTATVLRPPSRPYGLTATATEKGDRPLYQNSQPRKNLVTCALVRKSVFVKLFMLIV